MGKGNEACGGEKDNKIDKRGWKERNLERGGKERRLTAIGSIEGYENEENDLDSKVEYEREGKIGESENKTLERKIKISVERVR